MIHETFGKGKCLAGNKPNDKIYTPEKVAKLIISKFNLTGKVLDAFSGDDVFLKIIQSMWKRTGAKLIKAATSLSIRIE